MLPLQLLVPGALCLWRNRQALAYLGRRAADLSLGEDAEVAELVQEWKIENWNLEMALGLRHSSLVIRHWTVPVPPVSKSISHLLACTPARVARLPDPKLT